MTNSKPYILIVDDDEFIQRLISETLDSEGYETATAASAEECYRKLGSKIPDLMVLDIMLPGQDGFELCRNFRKNKSTLFTPVLMLSSKSRVQDRVIGLEAGADDYLVKPFHLDELVARIKALLRRTYREETFVPDVEIKKALGDAIQKNGQRPLKAAAARNNRGETSKSAPAAGTGPKPSSQPTPIRKPVKKAVSEESLDALIGPDADFDTRKKVATELYQKRDYDKAHFLFEQLSRENPKDQYCKKYLEVTRNSMMKMYMKVLGSKDNVPIRTSSQSQDFIGLDFNTQEGFIFSRIDGVTDFKGIVAISGMKPVTAYGILYNLFESGVITIRK